MPPEWHPTDDPLVEFSVGRGEEVFRLRRTTRGGWRIESVYALPGDELVLTELHITCAKPDPGSGQTMQSVMMMSPMASPTPTITARFLRTVRLDAERDLAQRLAVEHGVPLGEPRASVEELNRLVAIAIPVFEEMRHAEPAHPGRKGRPDAYLAIIAAVYTSALSKKSANPVKETADDLDLSPEYVRDALHRARVRELLTRAPKGRAGGTLTEKGRHALLSVVSPGTL
jgi:hypothetical protein